MAVDLHVHAVLDPFEPRQLALAYVGIVVFDHHRRLQIAAVRDQRVVGVEFILDAGFLKGLLDAQHLLDLVAHRQLVLEDQRDVRAEVQRAVLLVRDHARAELLALARIGLEREQRVAGNLGHGHLLVPSCP